ncbi:hypothetical protein BFJ68_g17208 [Fusarium oxysporum]|uniref:Uncharacterized protein n=1 Tax=Fusarium oxysporum TaxID=5507 RepID=A0A420NM58_FUSOX|nr:hypothetical protein BFJ71_g15609 [Fusarium oxysporum]RKK85899.1 hypothetical protein BFJ68_g17208 [Fusarium oxysporum]
MANHSAGADIALPEIGLDEILDAINDDIVDLSLAELYNEVHREVETALDQTKESLKDGLVDLDLYLRLNDVLLALQHWSDDIIVHNESPLATIENDYWI